MSSESVAFVPVPPAIPAYLAESLPSSSSSAEPLPILDLTHGDEYLLEDVVIESEPVEKEVQSNEELILRDELQAEVEEELKFDDFEQQKESVVTQDDEETKFINELSRTTSSSRNIAKSSFSSSRRMSTTSLATRYKVVFLGDSQVGKTATIARYVMDTFSSVYQTTVGIDFMSKTMQLDDRTVRLQLWDTAGQEKFRSLIPSYIRDSAIAFVVYDVTNRASFLNVEEWIKKVREERDEDAVIVLVGNKTDLESSRQVTSEEGAKLAAKHNVLFEETSAKTGDNVKLMFRKAAIAIKDANVAEFEAKVTHIKLDARKKTTEKDAGSCIC